MKKLWFLLWFLFAAPAFAQVVTTSPNIGLSLPCVPGDPGCNPQGHPNWGPIINADLLIIDDEIYRAKMPRVTVATRPTAPETNQTIVVTDAFNGATCTTGGGISNNTCQWTGSAWVVIGGGGGGASDFNQLTGTATDAQIPNLNVLSTGLTASRCVQTDGAGLLTVAAGPCPTTASSGTPGNITVSGAGVIDLGTTAVQTDQSNTWTTGDQNMAAAASFTYPTATGANPTQPGRCAFDSTAQAYKCGLTSGATITLAPLGSVQPLSANLTAFAGLTGSNGKMPYFTAAGAMALTSGLETPCADVAGQHLNLSSIGTFVCGTSSTGGITGQTTGALVKALSPTSLGPSIITEAAGVATVGGGFVVGTGPYLTLNTAAIASTDKTWTVLNFDGTVRPSTGALTPGNMVTTNANGLLIDGGAAGTGTWTDSSTNTGTNKTFVATGAGGTNTITVPIFGSFDGGALTPDGTNCTDATKTTINSGPTQYAFVCPTPNSAVFDANIIGIKQAVTTIRVRLKANDTVSTKALAGTFKAQCRPTGNAPSSTWGTTQTVTITLTTLNITYEGLTAAITPNGTCSAGADLYIRYNATGASNSATTRIIGLVIEQLS